MKKQRLILKRVTFSLLCLSLLTTACKKKSDDPAPSDEVFMLKQSKLSGANQNPVISSNASGTVEGSYNSTSNKLTYKISYTGLTPESMHIHSAFAGSNGPVVFDLAVPSSSPAEATVMLDDAQELDLLAGKLYVNIHTAANTNGEIRAQILTSNTVLYQNTLSGNNQVPAISTTSGGTFYGTYNKSTKIMNYVFAYTGAVLNGSHIHDGLAGKTGAVAFSLNVPVSGAATTGMTTAFSPVQEANLEAGKMYVNIHSSTNPNGEVRAQLANENVSVFNNIILSGANQVPAVTTTASGKAYVTYNAITSSADYVLITNDFTPTSAHIHAGAAGVNGDVLYELTIPAAAAGPLAVTTSGTITSISAINAEALKAGNTYINLHTAVNMGGELRGQIQ
jgi:trimeric autotransporter adhesin